MIHARPKRRLGAALLVGVAGACLISFAQQPWQLARLTEGGRHRRLEPRAFGVERSELRDAVNAGSKAPIVGPAPIIDAAPKVTGAIVAELPAAPRSAAGDGFRWEMIGGQRYYCKGLVCGRYTDDRWVWLQQMDGRWWQRDKDGSWSLLADDAPAKK